MKKTLALLTLAATATLLTAPAQAQFAKPDDAIKYRKAAFTVMGAHFGRIGAMVNGKAPFDAKAAAENADLVATMSHLPWSAFGPDTDLGDTKAKPEIWKEQAKFKQGAEKLQAEAAKLAAAAKTGNLDNLKAAFGPTAETCKACHDAFRAK
ncbi:cytochrome c556 [Tibeticola sediminis]|jgi:cytochrome c556|uniref:Cytochrome c556 n=1 Tax=Tibeticola sediminis TaxID=1917811 RepID=A0A3N4VES4_9BURK|nr:MULTISPECIES: cytochrome c [Tibeticola]MCI4440589.1 cytochrome c [Tibeticola sp.]RPE72370.1 cytochrome c556 [Tibeticola sediminis]